MKSYTPSFAQVDEGTYPVFAVGAVDEPNAWIHRNCGTTDEFWITYEGNHGVPFRRIDGTGADETLVIHPYPAAGTTCADILHHANAVAFRDWVSQNPAIYGRPAEANTATAIAVLDCHHYVMNGGNNGPAHAVDNGLFEPGSYRVFQDGAVNASAYVWRGSNDSSVEVWRLVLDAFEVIPFQKPNPTMANPTTLVFVKHVDVHASLAQFRDWTHQDTVGGLFEEHRGSFYWID